MTRLPIDERIEEIVSTAYRATSLLLEAPPGAGKTTRVPRALWQHRVAEGEVVVLQPRRLATRLAARRVADELAEPLGQTVGYQIRFEDVTSAKTRLRFVTEGVLERRLISDPLLNGVGVVVLDEFHERNIAGDVCLALLRRLQRGRRPDLKLLVMSATLNAGPIAAYLGHCPVLRSEGRSFNIAIEYLATADPRPLEQQVLAGLKRALAAQRTGHILVFLPGAAEIRRAAEACSDFARVHQWMVRPLHGDLSAAEQDRAIEPSTNRKLILSTNVAETSVTIEGIGCVIDSGLARVASHSPWSGLPTLNTQKISKASAIQRAGRAGRTQEGWCLRLYTQSDFGSRPDFDLPEIRRADLTETLLVLRASGVTDLSDFEFLEAPSRASIDAADLLLRRLGAIDSDGRITQMGKRLAEFPLHPRQGRLVAEAEARGVGQDGALLAALLGERDIRLEARSNLRTGTRANQQIVSGPSDLLDAVERFREAERAGFASARLRELALDPSATRNVGRVQRQIARGVRSMSSPRQPADNDEALLISTLAGYPDRVAKRRTAHSRELLLFEGGTALLSEASVVSEPPLLVAVEAEERKTAGVPKSLVRVASKVEPEWLLEVAPKAIVDQDDLQWNPQTEQVERVQKLSYGEIVLEERRSPAAPCDAVAALLANAARSAPIQRFADPETLERWTGRAELLRRSFPETNFPELNLDALRSLLGNLAAGKRSFEELTHPILLEAFAARFTPEQARLWRTMAPERIELPSGRQLKVHYARSKPPWVESRLQDFFGLAKGPSVAAGRIPLVLHLLAPNQRAVQVTDDLAGFWSRHYPGIRRELSRKYPRHAWPEDPLHSSPPSPRRPGRSLRDE
jgi:ATP-dependent helicase HrpB